MSLQSLFPDYKAVSFVYPCRDTTDICHNKPHGLFTENFSDSLIINISNLLYLNHARLVPDFIRRVTIEPSFELFTRLQIIIIRCLQPFVSHFLAKDFLLHLTLTENGTIWLCNPCI